MSIHQILEELPNLAPEDKQRLLDTLPGTRQPS
jgi:hypothetical protein